MTRLGRRVAVLQEVVRHLRWSGHLGRALEAEDEDVEHESVVLVHGKISESYRIERREGGAPGR